MLGLGRSKESVMPAQPPAPIAVVDKPKPRLVVVGKDPLDEYSSLAKDLGFMPAQLLEEQLLRFMKAQGIERFDYEEVNRYMTSLAEPKGVAWIWRPLREKDKPESFTWRGRGSSDGKIDEFRGHGSYRSEWEYRPYPRAVPLRILRDVKKIEDAFGSQLKFFVSDYRDPNPDPFIMVTALDVEKIIFGVWDEPGFGTSI